MVKLYFECICVLWYIVCVIFYYFCVKLGKVIYIKYFFIVYFIIVCNLNFFLILE